MLDRSLPMGTVHSQPGVAFYQNGKHYNAEGYEVNFATGERIEKIAPKKATPKPPPEPDPETDEDPEGQQDGAEGGDEPPKDVIAKNGVNLSAWARGEATDLSIAKVKNAVEEVFGKRPKDGTEALKIIAGEEIE